MEHTHLVKGLDYALLQKVRSELEDVGNEDEESADTDTKKEVKTPVVDVDPSTFHTKLARNIHRVLFKNTLPERNELFATGRMAYVIDLEDEYAESDIPTTVIRSKADVPTLEGQATLTTNDIVINKLAQILSYLRAGNKASKRNKKNKEAIKGEEKQSSSSTSRRTEDDSIYGDIGDYNPTTTKSRSSHSKQDKGDRSGSKKHQYFEKPAEEEEPEVILTNPTSIFAEGKRDKPGWVDDEKAPEQTFGSVLKKEDKSLSRAQKLLSKMNAEPEGYAECYPGFDEMHDAIDDSDEETDFSKMDPGKKKGTVGRWDFDTVEEYSDYMSNKEALPKAAFQFGVKMNDGRKTRKAQKTEKNEKAQLDRQWQQIQTMMQKRKASGLGLDGAPDMKTPRN
jgi:IK cytokine